MKPIPVDAVRQIADQWQKDIVLVVAWNEASSTTTVVTWGREPPQKVSAATAGDMIRRMLRLEGRAEVHEDFRREGEAASTVDALRRQLSAVRDALDKIVVTEGQDAGVILLSAESPIHYDAKRKCQVYEYENFSPLGDALIALSKLITGKP